MSCFVGHPVAYIENSENLAKYRYRQIMIAANCFVQGFENSNFSKTAYRKIYFNPISNNNKPTLYILKFH